MQALSVIGAVYGEIMIDFQNSSIFKLSEANPQEILKDIHPLFVQGEELIVAFKGMRDYVAFTNKRIIAVNVQGFTGTKRDYTSMPYSKIQSFSVESAGTWDLDGELDLWFSGLGKVRFEFKGKVDVRALARIIGTHVL